MKVHNPYRSEYNHSYSHKECPFCNGEIIDKQNIKQLEGDSWMIFVNYYPLLDGNLMLVSKRHVEDLSELNEVEWDEFRVKLEESRRVLSKLLQTNSFNIGINIGSDSGSSVRHLHWQVVPRLKKQPVNGFAGLIAGIQTIRFSPEELKEKILEQSK